MEITRASRGREFIDMASRADTDNEVKDCKSYFRTNLMAEKEGQSQDHLQNSFMRAATNVVDILTQSSFQTGTNCENLLKRIPAKNDTLKDVLSEVAMDIGLIERPILTSRQVLNLWMTFGNE